MSRLRVYTKWLTPGIGVKRWLVLLLIGITVSAVSILLGILKYVNLRAEDMTLPILRWREIALVAFVGLVFVSISVFRIAHNILEPYRKHQRGAVVDVVYAHSKRQRGMKLVAIGGGTGLPAVLRGLKAVTSNITAVVTVADDGGSSGRLRRDLQMLPPGDLRNNIAALADDESLMTQLFQYRFSDGDLGGHAFGNLFISALAGVTGSLETALVETARVLNIQGRVLPATLQDVTLCASVTLPGTKRTTYIRGESKISEAGGKIEQLELDPANVAAYGESMQAILDADVVVLGPGSLYTSILPNLLVKGIADALRTTGAHKLYVCNVATQPGETADYTVAEHVLALEKYIGRGIFQSVLANNVYPALDGTSNTCYVQSAPHNHEILQRYNVRYTDLVDTERPWRHDASKLAAAILALLEAERSQPSASVGQLEV
jgi:uncharacterized cofD-like protein